MVQTTQRQPPQHHLRHNLPRSLRRPIRFLPTMRALDVHDSCGHPLGVYPTSHPLYSIYFQHLRTPSLSGTGMMVESIRSIKSWTQACRLASNKLIDIQPLGYGEVKGGGGQLVNTLLRIHLGRTCFSFICNYPYVQQAIKST